MSTRSDSPRFFTTRVVSPRDEGAQLYIMVDYFPSVVDVDGACALSGQNGQARPSQRTNCLLISAPESAEWRAVVIAIVGVALLTIGIGYLHRRIENRIDEINRL